MTPQELKNSILQLAIQGKLVEQRPEEGTGEELYQQIQAEKQALIKAGKLKKEKPLPEISEEEKPFEIPESWKWVRIANTWDVLNGDRGKNYPAKTTLSHKGIPFISALNLNGKTIIYDDNLLCLSEEQYNKLGNGKLIQGDIVVCIRGSLGKHGRFPLERGAIASSLVIMRSHLSIPALDDFLMLFLDSPLFFGEIKRYDNGTAQPNLAARSLELFLFPLPPLAEQKRIVSKIEELLPLLDCYEQAWNRLEDFNKRFPTDLQKSILQLAIQGKLVPQRPEEGTGEELYQQIQAEKQALIKAGKLKKEKPLPEITEAEKPFEIPESWKWVRFSELMLSMSTGPFGSMLHKSDYIENGIPLVNPANIINGKILSSNKMMVSSETRKRLNSYILHSGMIVIGRRGEMGRCAVVSDAEEGWLCGTGSFFMEPSKMLSAQYLQIIFTTPYVKSYLCGESVGTTMSNLNHKILSMMPIPLPPYKEQKRIDSELEYVLSFCELKK